MSEYRTAWCQACGQGAYLPERAFKGMAWRCPSCGAENPTEELQRPVLAGVAAQPSRFGRMIVHAPASPTRSNGSRPRRGLFRMRV